MDIRYAFVCEDVEADPDGLIRSILRIVRPNMVWGAERFPFVLSPYVVFFGVGLAGSTHTLTVTLLDGTNPPLQRTRAFTVPPTGIAEGWMQIGTLTITAPLAITVELLLDRNPLPFLIVRVPIERLQ